MGLPRFRVESCAADRLRLPEAEAHHAVRVQRLRIGDRVAIFDGAGTTATGEIRAIDAAGVEVAVLERCVAATPARLLDMAVAMPKGERSDWLVEKLAELGVARLIPLRTRRTVVVPAENKLERWRRKCVAAAKQCGAAREMRIAEPLALAELLAEPGRATLLLMADPGAPAGSLVAAARESAQALALIGPEGGFTPDEQAALTHAGARAVRLTTTTLRIETAAVVLAGAWLSLEAS